MTTAERLTAIAENEAKAREANEKLDLCLKGNKVDAKSWYDEFWDDFQDNGNRTLYENAFSGKGWTDNNFKPKYDIILEGQYSCNGTFRQSKITDIKGILERQGITIDFSQATYATNTFQNSSVKRLPVINLDSCIKMQSTFHTCGYLEEVEISNLLADCTFSYDFQRCGSLTKLILTNSTIGQNGFNVQWSTTLSADSLKSIIAALSTSTTGLTITLPTTAQANYEAVYGTGSGETLTASRSNWTIAYA